MRLKQDPREVESILDSTDEYQRLLSRYSGLALEQCRVLEIGFGARPLRLIALMSRGCDVLGVDLDRPVITGSAGEFAEILKLNGAERLAKSLVRHLLFDGQERRILSNALAARGHKMKITPERFIVADAGSEEFNARLGDHCLDLIVSEDVFEHIEPESLNKLVARMSRWLRPEGLALITPDIFTGITGGHLLEWYAAAVDSTAAKQTQPWEHLRKNRVVPNTYLNKLSRRDYRSLFLKHFEIVDEIVARPDLGRQFYTPEVAAELQQYDEEELFSNNVMFILKPRISTT